MARTFSLLLALALPATRALGVSPNDDMFDKFAVLRAPPNENKFAVLRALDDTQLMAEVAQRNLNARPRCS